MLLQASILGELGAISFPFTLNLFCSKVVFVLPMRHQFEINRGQAKKADPRNCLFTKIKERKLHACLYSTTDARNIKETTLLLSSLRNKESVISHLFTFE